MRSRVMLSVFAATLLAACGPTPVALPEPALESSLIAQLTASERIEAASVLDELGLIADAGSPRGFVSADPYRPTTPLEAEACNREPACRELRGDDASAPGWFPARAVVVAARAASETEPDRQQVCAVAFDAPGRYRLLTVPDASLLGPNATPTHYGACGTCSSLADLAVYATLDLTRSASRCALRPTLRRQKACFEALGFSEACAETWAYNARHTRRHCTLTCVGVMARGWFGTGGLASGEDGELDPCLRCDEVISGPGFQYAAGRTRRNSGIAAEIERAPEEVRAIRHDYFTP